jgi:hypothetical protein
MPQVPFVDSDGNLVTHDRRKIPDRRLDPSEKGRRRK